MTLSPITCFRSVKASEMADALSAVATKLYEWHLLKPEGAASLHSEAKRLRRFSHSTTWKLAIGREEPISFAQAKDKNNKPVDPQLICEIEVDQSQTSKPPFIGFEIAIEVYDLSKKIVSRWHIDLANAKESGMQHGPLIHLQYGGHVPGQRQWDHPLKEPRWSFPPMDVVLLCEMMAANFYPEEWEQLREDQGWCKAIAVGQRLCYSAYVAKMAGCLSATSRSMLHSMWASEWA